MFGCFCSNTELYKGSHLHAQVQLLWDFFLFPASTKWMEIFTLVRGSHILHIKIPVSWKRDLNRNRNRCWQFFISKRPFPFYQGHFTPNICRNMIDRWQVHVHDAKAKDALELPDHEKVIIMNPVQDTGFLLEDTPAVMADMCIHSCNHLAADILVLEEVPMV